MLVSSPALGVQEQVQLADGVANVGGATFSSRVCEAPSPITASGDCSSSRVWKRLSDVTVKNSISALGCNP